MQNRDLGKILIWMGIITLILTVIDFYTLVIPLGLKNKEWVFSVTQSISDRSIIPLIGMGFLLLGLNFAREKTNENLFKNIERATGIISLIFAIGLAGCAIMYALSAPGVENKIFESLKTQKISAKEKLNAFYDQYKGKIDQEKYNMLLENIETQTMIQINQTNSNIIKTTFKTMLTLIFFSILQMYIFLKIFELIDFIKYRILKFKRTR